MARFKRNKGIRKFARLTGVVAALTTTVMAQNGAMTTPAANRAVLNSTYHVSFDRPEAWGLKYFASSTLLSGLEIDQPDADYRVGSAMVGLELGWMPMLDAGQLRIGFNGTKPEDLNKAPVLVRPVVKVRLPHKFSVLAAAPPPFRVFGVTPHLFAFGIERPVMERAEWTLGWRAYGQVGSVKGAFTCPRSVLAFASGSAKNPTGCVGESADVSSLRYAGIEFQFAHRIASMPKLVPHATVGANLIDGVFQLHAPVEGGLDKTRLWTRGATFSTTFGASYHLTSHVAFTVDAFYSPLWVRRSAMSPSTNDGLFNVRALLSYVFQAL